MVFIHSDVYLAYIITFLNNFPSWSTHLFYLVVFNVFLKQFRHHRIHFDVCAIICAENRVLKLIKHLMTNQQLLTELDKRVDHKENSIMTYISSTSEQLTPLNYPFLHGSSSCLILVSVLVKKISTIDNFFTYL